MKQVETKKLYRKIYIYAILSVVASLLLTVGGMSVLFRQNEKDRFQHHFLRDAGFIQYVVQNAYSENPRSLELKITEMGKFFHWNISYWKDKKLVFNYGSEPLALESQEVQRLAQESTVLVEKREPPPIVIIYLNPQNPKDGYLQMSFDKGFHPGLIGQGIIKPPPPPPSFFSRFLIATLLILGFLALLLRPFSSYLLKPYKELSASIGYVAEGDFTKPIKLDKKSEFYGIAQAFNEMVAQIQRMFAEKQRLLADVSHELRSPLARMQVNLEILEKEGKGKAKCIERSLKELKLLDEIIENILDISALELNAQNFPLEKINLVHTVQEFLESHQDILNKHELSYRASLPATAIMINGRTDLIDRTLSNVFSNLIKYAPQSSQVDIELIEEEEKAILKVRDYGPGVSQQELNKVLEAFYRTDESRTRKTGGTGLGLAIVDKIMQLHRGTIKLRQPEDGQGGLVVELSWPKMGTRHLNF